MEHKYDIVRTPDSQEKLTEMLTEYAPFFDAMYPDIPEDDPVQVAGKTNFILDWLFVMSEDTGFILTKRSTVTGELLAVALLTKYCDMWSRKNRIDIQRVSLKITEDLNEDEEIENMVDYLVSISPIMKFDTIYFCTRDKNGDELRKQMWAT